MNYRERKAARTAYYFEFVYQRRLVACLACNGSGRYDSNGSPLCGGCDGTGKEREPDWMQRERLDAMTDGEIYKCPGCQQTFRKAVTEEEARAEQRKNFGDVPDSEMEVVCVDCFKEIMAWNARQN